MMPVPTRRRRAAVAAAWTASTAGAIAFVGAIFGFEGAPDFAFAILMVTLASGIVVYASVGALVAIRRPGNPIGSVLLAAAVLLATTFCGFVFGAGASLTQQAADPLGGIGAIVGGLALFPALILAGPALALVFPDGRLPGPRWRWAVAVTAAMMALGLVLIAARPGPVSEGLADNPLGLAGESWRELGDLGLSLALLALATSLVLGVAAVIVRYRRGSSVERAQLRWFLAANVSTAVFLTLTFLDGAGDTTVIDMLAVLSLSLPPLAVGVAVLRYRLYEIDRIVSRTLSYAIVTGVLGAVFVGLMLLLQAALAGLTGSTGIPVAISTLFVFALFQPVMRRVRRVVDRRFDRARYDAERTANDFADRLRRETDMERVTGDLRATVESAVVPRSLDIWLRTGRPNR